MSHAVTIQTLVKDINALRDACDELGLQLVSNGQVRGYAGRTVEAEHVIQLKGPYDIAVTSHENGMYTFTTDWWEGHVEKEVGKNYGKLLQLYGVHKTIREAKRKGYTVSRKTVARDGSIKITLGGVK